MCGMTITPCSKRGYIDFAQLTKVLLIHPYHPMSESPIHLMPLVHRALHMFLLMVRYEP